MTKEEYTQLRLRPEWQKKRLEVFQRDGFECQHCYEPEKTLHVHHRYYIKGRMPWDYPMWALVTLCDGCHKAEGDAAKDDVGTWESILQVLSNGSYDCLHFTWELTHQITQLREKGVSNYEIFESMRQALEGLK